MTDSYTELSPLRGPMPVPQVLIRVQAVAGGLFLVFLALHLSNVLIAPLGVEAFNDYQAALRQFYQHPVVEIVVLMVPLAAHAIAGIWLRVLRRKRGARPPRNLHFWAGIFLLVFVPGHILAVRGPSFVYGIYPQFEGVAFSLWFMPFWFYPYYFVLAMAGLYHGLNGIGRLLVRKGVMSDTRRLMLPVMTIAGIGVAISLMSLGGVFFETPDPMDNDFARLYIKLLDSI